MASNAQVVARVLQGARLEKPDNLGGQSQEGLWDLVEICWWEEAHDRPDAAFLLQTLDPWDDDLLMASITDVSILFQVFRMWNANLVLVCVIKQPRSPDGLMLDFVPIAAPSSRRRTHKRPSRPAVSYEEAPLPAGVSYPDPPLK